LKSPQNLAQINVISFLTLNRNFLKQLKEVCVAA